MFKTIIKISLITLLIFSALTPNFIVHAADDFIAPTIAKPDYLPGPEKDAVATEGRNILTQSVLPKLAIRFIGLIGSIALIFIIIGGVRYAISYGKEDGIENAKNQVIYAVVGFLVAIMAYTIVSIVVNIQFEGNQRTGPAQGPAIENPQ